MKMPKSDVASIPRRVESAWLILILPLAFWVGVLLASAGNNAEGALKELWTSGDSRQKAQAIWLLSRLAG